MLSQTLFLGFYWFYYLGIQKIQKRVIKKEKNTSKLEIKKSVRNLKFKDYYANYKKFLRVISVEELKEKY